MIKGIANAILFYFTSLSFYFKNRFIETHHIGEIRSYDVTFFLLNKNERSDYPI